MGLAILENVKNQVDTSLKDEAPLAKPDMSAKSGVTPSSAGTPKLSMRTEGGTFRTVTNEPTPNPFEAAAAAITEPEQDPFGAGQNDGRGEVESMLQSAREVVHALEAALEKAKKNERSLAEKLARL